MHEAVAYTLRHQEAECLLGGGGSGRGVGGGGATQGGSWLSGVLPPLPLPSLAGWGAGGGAAVGGAAAVVGRAAEAAAAALSQGLSEVRGVTLGCAAPCHVTGCPRRPRAARRLPCVPPLRREHREARYCPARDILMQRLTQNPVTEGICCPHRPAPQGDQPGGDAVPFGRQADVVAPAAAQRPPVAVFRRAAAGAWRANCGASALVAWRGGRSRDSGALANGAAQLAGG